MSKKIHVEYYALLRSQSGKDAESLETELSRYDALYDQLSEKYGFTVERSSLRLAVNESFEPFDRAIEDGDTVVFITPVAGG